MSLSNNHRKLITSLSRKKYRQSHKLFIAEGVKVVDELLNSELVLHSLFATENYENNHPDVIRISEADLKKISQLKTPNKVLAVFEIPEVTEVNNSGLVLALDSITDPGNLGTIIRLCDWFGITDLLCSSDTVDCYNSKVVQASMGSLTRVNIHYLDLVDFLNMSSSEICIADMKGENAYKTQLPKNAILVMGNEANGISNEVKTLATKTVSIPRFGAIQKTESLNVATATAILLSEFRR